MKMFATVDVVVLVTTFLTVLCVTTFAENPATRKQGIADEPSALVSGNNIAFDVPDVTMMVDTPDGELLLEAYRSTHNDRILQDAENSPGRLSRISRLSWVSLGNPMFIKTSTTYANSSRLSYFRI